ncbi:MAG: lipopolysaccharide transport periplasmic protein LptA, partial [Gammaproteobacteria bacterium]|nr:lipopolysaccharide transport periplasmic protein LptA [Gammaproteobacteria bacterium]
LSKIIAYGKPAIFTQAPNEQTEGVEARAATIEYEANTQTLLLTQNVELRQGENRFTGEVVRYDIPNNVMKASGNETNRRVQATIQLNQLKQ